MNPHEPAQARGSRRKKTAQIGGFLSVLAERAGFEPAVGYYPTHAFQACDLNRSSTSPRRRIVAEAPGITKQTGMLQIIQRFPNC